MNNRQIDNSFLNIKKNIRKKVLNLIDKDHVNILNLYAGFNKCWEFKTNKSIAFLNIEKDYKKGKSIYGDNKKFIKNIDLDFFDIIDLDAYGHPWGLVDSIHVKKPIYVIYTFIQTFVQNNNNCVLKYSGITKKMRGKCPVLFKNRLFLIHFLNKKRIDSLYNIRLNEKKEYGFFIINPE